MVVMNPAHPPAPLIARVALVALVGAAALTPPAALIPPATAQVLPGPNGPVEFIGLQEWDAQELFDAIRERDPDRPFHACAAVMRMELGFADAGAFLYTNPRSTEWYTVVVGVEDSARVRYRPVGSDRFVLPETWQKLVDIMEDDWATMAAAAYALPSRGGFLGLLGGAKRRAEEMGADPELYGRLSDLVDEADTEEDRRLIHDVLASDASAEARTVATLLLVNFMDDSASWHALVGSAIDPVAQVSSVAMSILSAFVSGTAPTVDWSGARDPLSAVLAGTNPFAFTQVLQILAATDIDRDFGQQLVRENPDLLLAYAGAEHVPTRVPALGLLRAVSGEDFGTDVDAWRAWIEG